MQIGEASTSASPHSDERPEQRVPFKLALRNRWGRPLADHGYAIEVGAETIEGRTDAEGRIDIEIPPSRRIVALSAWSGDDRRRALRWRVVVGRLASPDSARGVASRLRNLGVGRGQFAGMRLTRALAELHGRLGEDPAADESDARATAIERHDSP